jgi:hypothetical protein
MIFRRRRWVIIPLAFNCFLLIQDAPITLVTIRRVVLWYDFHSRKRGHFWARVIRFDTVWNRTEGITALVGSQSPLEYWTKAELFKKRPKCRNAGSNNCKSVFNGCPPTDWALAWCLWSNNEAVEYDIHNLQKGSKSPCEIRLRRKCDKISGLHNRSDASARKC